MEGIPSVEVSVSQTVGSRVYTLRNIVAESQVKATKEHFEKLLAEMLPSNQPAKPVSPPVENKPQPTTQKIGPPASPTPPAKPTPQPTTAPPNNASLIDKLRITLPEDIEARLGFEERGEYIVVKPKQFLGSDNFAKVAAHFRSMGGEYISAGQDSHFRVLKKLIK